MDERELEEILELVWVEAEFGRVTVDDLLKVNEPRINSDIIDELVRSEFIIIKAQEVLLSEKGERIASKIVRCHRLAERLFWDVLELSTYKDIEETACTFEHLLSSEVADAICTLLGHPKECPHGGKIPRGDCCAKAEHEIESVVFPLSRLKAAERGRIAYISTKHHSRLDKLSAFGLFPGVEVRVHQTFPSFVIQVEHSHIALDKEILDDIYVRRR